jgi:hypothetical protein
MTIERIRTVTEPFRGNYPQDGGHPFSRDREAWRCSICSNVWLQERVANAHVCEGASDEI